MEKKYINPFHEESAQYARLFDEATQNKNANELRKLIDEVLEKIETLDIASQSHLYYSIGTVYGDLAQIERNEDEESIRRQLFFFRKSIDCLYSDELSKEEYEPYTAGLKLNLHTNLGNTLDRCGRKISAIKQYQRALTVHADFGMASGNLGTAYFYYASLVSEAGERDHLHRYALSFLQEACKSTDPGIYEEARNSFKGIINAYDAEYKTFLERPIELSQTQYEDDEFAYRTWCVENGLFLNVLNDLPIQNLCFAEDSLQLPPMVAKLDDKPIYHGMFNQFKQEYIFARYQYYSSLEFGDEAHFADRKTHLTNLFDYPLYSIRIESLKSAYKTLYSLLDKIAFFLNYYFELGLLDRLISFHNVWDRNKTKNNSLEYAQNYGLSALYWISRDLYKEQSQSAHPHAKRLSDIRNALEHRYVKVCWPFATELSEKRRDSSAFYISEDELRIQSMELLGIVREALISLTIAVFIEEKKRKAKRGDNEKIVPLHLHSYDDEWKI